jgi:DNA-directed RNA polymerase subunit RPC12/RpoP
MKPVKIARCPHCFGKDFHIYVCLSCGEDVGSLILIPDIPEGCVEIRDHELIRPAVVN